MTQVVSLHFPSFSFLLFYSSLSISILSFLTLPSLEAVPDLLPSDS